MPSGGPRETITATKGGDGDVRRTVGGDRAASDQTADGDGAAAGSGFPAQPDLPIGTVLLPKIKHIVVLMKENHSYDNYLGLLAGRGPALAPRVIAERLETDRIPSTQAGGAMPFVSVGSENGASIDIYYEDHGSGQPVVLIHGYPLNGRSWERQERDLLAAGYRVIAYDRRGFGNSSRPVTGYDYDTFTADLNALLEHLNLTDIYLCGFSMGTGEVTHYLGTHGSGRVKKAALLGAIPPFLLNTADNPEGVDKSVFEGIKSAIVADRYAYFSDFFANFYNTDVLGGTRISDQAVQASFSVAAASSPYATYACVDTWLTDFRADLPNIDVPVLVLHGTADRILPFENTAKRLPGLIKDVTVIPVENGPHNVGWTYPEVVNPALLSFLAS